MFRCFRMSFFIWIVNFQIFSCVGGKECQVIYKIRNGIVGRFCSNWINLQNWSKVRGCFGCLVVFWVFEQRVVWWLYYYYFLRVFFLNEVVFFGGVVQMFCFVDGQYRRIFFFKDRRYFTGMFIVTLISVEGIRESLITFLKEKFVYGVFFVQTLRVMVVFYFDVIDENIKVVIILLQSNRKMFLGEYVGVWSML